MSFPPSGQEVITFPVRSISILDILVGFARSRTSRPRNKDVGPVLDWSGRLPIPSIFLRNTTDSVKRIVRVFF